MPASTMKTLQEQVGQLLIMGFEATEPTARLRSMLSAIQPGGVVLFARNIVDPRQTWELLRECQKWVRTPLFCCVDMEGGTVDRLKNILAPAPSPAEVFDSGNKKLFRLHGRFIGSELRALGFNVDFAPACDLALPPSRKVLTSRVVSSDPKQVVQYVREFLHGLRDAKVLGCGKHFPGLGDGNFDTHKQIATIDKPFKRLWDEDMVPYRELHNKMSFVMASHAAYPAVTGDEVPASLSKKLLRDTLRKKIGYKGIIISDDLEMGAVLDAAASIADVRRDSPECVGAAALATMKAGSDVCLVCRDADAVMASFQAVVREAERDRRFAARVQDSVKRVTSLKRRAALEKLRCPSPKPATVNKLRRDLWQFAEEVRLVKASM